MEDNSGTAPLKITINGQEYDTAEAQDYIETGRKTRELEKQYNTKFDSVWPEYGRITQEKQRLTTELEEYKRKTVEGNATTQDKADATNAAAQLGVKLEDLDKAGYIKKTELDTYLEERDSKKETTRAATDAVLKSAEKLETDINGSDGRPKFKKAAVIAYASSYGFSDLQKAYESMWEEELKGWKDLQIEKEKRKGLQTQGAGGKKEPATPKVSKDNVGSILKESLWGAEE